MHNHDALAPQPPTIPAPALAATLPDPRRAERAYTADLRGRATADYLLSHFPGMRASVSAGQLVVEQIRRYRADLKEARRLLRRRSRP